ncbi:hypothetical protein Tco_1096662, partial [Tanacetum coccineum]
TGVGSDSVVADITGGGDEDGNGSEGDG